MLFVSTLAHLLDSPLLAEYPLRSRVLQSRVLKNLLKYRQSGFNSRFIDNEKRLSSKPLPQPPRDSHSRSRAPEATSKITIENELEISCPLALGESLNCFMDAVWKLGRRRVLSQHLRLVNTGHW